MSIRRVLVMAGLPALLAVSALGAETVMVYVCAQSSHDDYLLSAVEAGIMEVFFDAGHIVFNAGTYERVSDVEIQRRSWVRNLSRQGGATRALEVEVDLGEFDGAAGAGGQNLFARSVRFRYLSIEPAGVIERGRIEASRPASGGRRDVAAFDLGVAVARAALQP
ncbi:MAG: hypothetical protein EA384_00625 [Spirochaetaceae bacterium]|nr:MAG: hypothetical protein EA384_00625 [Spirochaetaceae bacterium]